MKVRIILDEGKVSGGTTCWRSFSERVPNNIHRNFLFVPADALFLEHLHRRVFGEEYFRK
ncbi:hypothetical protein L3T28_004431 [Salmonella enterica subsp. enterica serovar Miami]|nr:hypothetical protein [Salmonella enterica]EHF3706205.1 hypothetical protein [Salmonella enterica subsp. enterica serovar Miami]EIT8914756.1 hypothetical protein [Salmonella enterica subsp. enterica serovar Miami]EJL1487631.1 hypothetical protein [Salmonella enterica]